jgi:cell division septum initiation protein DivIVA
MSMREQEAREFTSVLRGYDRIEVDEYVAWLRNQVIEAEDRATRAEAALVQCRRELASSPTTAGISQRLAAMLQLATEEADEIRARARAESEMRTREAANQAERMIAEATQRRDAIQREVDDLSETREELVQRMIELGGQILGATERYRGYLPGTAPLGDPRVQLFDAEADVQIDIDAVEEAPTQPPPSDGSTAAVTEP